MQIVQQALPSAQLIITGSGKYKSTLEAMSSSLTNVTFLGAQSRAQVKVLMSDAWLTCLPSIRMARGNEEAMSMVCLESQSVGTPLVGFATGGVSEGVEHGVSDPSII